jgi:signal-transduction protein with cAMP-binding, CBS, and nucleotidyltransferase domain
MEILSFLISPGDSQELITQPALDPRQLACVALELLSKQRVEFLSLCEENRYVGKIYLQDLVQFFNHKKLGHRLYFHKLNFDVRSAIIAMHQNSMS